MEVTKNGLMDMNEAASFLNVKKSTIYGMTMRREIPVVKIGKLNRFNRKDLEDFINASTQEKRNA